MSQETTVVRFNGGPQAGHGVVTPDGRYHIFAQFGSGTLVPGVQTFLSSYMLVDPWRMLMEEEHLQTLGVLDAFDRTFVSDDCLLVTPFHGIANRLRERARGDARHGSCGLGVGETVEDSLAHKVEHIVTIADVRDLDCLRAKLRWIQQNKREQLWKAGVIRACWNLEEARSDLDQLLDQSMIDVYLDTLRPFTQRAHLVDRGSLEGLLSAAPEVWVLTDLGFGDQGKGSTVDFLAATRPTGSVIFEPSQGVLLDEWHGFHPYTTWSTTTDSNALSLLHGSVAHRRKIRRLGILRAYATRHGAGPFPSYDADLTARLPDPPSARGEWQGDFRVGPFDTVLSRYAIQSLKARLDGLVITCMDRLQGVGDWRMVGSYQDPTGHRTDKITHGPFRDLPYQAALTDRLFKMKPNQRTLESSEAFLQAVRQELHLPVVLTSWGPTRDEKRWEPSRHQRFRLSA